MKSVLFVQSLAQKLYHMAIDVSDYRTFFKKRKFELKRKNLSVEILERELLLLKLHKQKTKQNIKYSIYQRIFNGADNLEELIQLVHLYSEINELLHNFYGFSARNTAEMVQGERYIFTELGYIAFTLMNLKTLLSSKPTVQVK